MKKLLTFMLAGCLAVALTTHASAAIVDGSGMVLGWNFTPFVDTTYGDWGDGNPPTGTGLGATEVGMTVDSSWTESNNASPIDLQNGGYIPAPVNNPTKRERFDLEFLGWRTVSGTIIQVLGITSAPPTGIQSDPSHLFNIGDVFIDTGNDGIYDLVLTASQWSTPLYDPLYPGDTDGYDHQMASGLYALNGIPVHGATSDQGFGNDPNYADDIFPFAIEGGAGLTPIAQDGDADFDYETQSYDYGIQYSANEDGTWFYSWTFDWSLMGVGSLQNMVLHWTTECGNDLIETEPVIPEPATVAMIGLGLASVGLFRSRRRRIRP
jgi:hypothetical protein